MPTPPGTHRTHIVLAFCASLLLSLEVHAVCFNENQFAYVAADEVAGDAFWDERCQSLKQAGELIYLKMEVNGQTFYVKPIEGSDWCGMLKSNNKHQFWDGNIHSKWKNANPKVFEGVNGGGGGVYWGSEVSTGASVDGSSWSQRLIASGCERCDLLSFLSGDMNADAQFWRNIACGEDNSLIPKEATKIRITSGSVVDYFKPNDEKKSLCAMLMFGMIHQWSADGADWKKIEYDASNSFLGGSSMNWPKNNIPGDSRTYLPFWGTSFSGVRGGCCGTSLQSTCGQTISKCFYQPMKIEYCF